MLVRRRRRRRRRLRRHGAAKEEENFLPSFLWFRLNDPLHRRRPFYCRSVCVRFRLF